MQNEYAIGLINLKQYHWNTPSLFNSSCDTPNDWFPIGDMTRSMIGIVIRTIEKKNIITSLPGKIQYNGANQTTKKMAMGVH